MELGDRSEDGGGGAGGVGDADVSNGASTDAAGDTRRDGGAQLKASMAHAASVRA